MRTKLTLDANEAVAHVAYQANEVIAIYPITPASPMGEWADQWASDDRPNAWGTIPEVVEMQSEGGAAGTVHGSLQTGAMTTTFTASQGLLLMLPNMYKIAGELTPCVIHVAARSLAAQALSIFGDHSDVMSVRMSGFGLLASNSVQEAHDMALVAHAASLESRIPFIHFFDGFRTSHEIQKIEMLDADDVRALMSDEKVAEFRARGMSPDRPVIRGTAQNPDVYFQARETVNPYYLACPTIVQNAMDDLAERTGRQYHLFDYIGDPEAERVIIMMGSGAETAEETVEALRAEGEKVGIVKVRLYRPFSAEHFLNVLPATVNAISVLDRTKEPGAVGEPLYQDVVTAISEAMAAGSAPFDSFPRVVGGRYGLSSKEFTPAMVKGVFDGLKQTSPKNHFTVGIVDDVTHTHLGYDESFLTEQPDNVRAVFYGLGSDGTVGANKNSIKIIGEETDNFAQGYFVYDSKKSGSVTISHLRFGPKPIRSSYLINKASFVACHQPQFLDRFDILKSAEQGAVFLLNSPYGPDEVWDHLPHKVQKHILDKNLRFFVIDAYKVAREAGMGGRINTIMQTCFFAISGVLPKDRAIEAIKTAIKKTYGKRGEVVVQKNIDAVESSLEHLHQVEAPSRLTASPNGEVKVAAECPQFFRDVTSKLIAGEGDQLPVSALPDDGTYPTGTTQYEKRNIAQFIPVWDPDVCIQCGKCVNVCPHAVIRANLVDEEVLRDKPESFLTANSRFPEQKEKIFTLQVSPEDCTGCALCVEVCPAKNKREVGRKAINMEAQPPILERERINWGYFVRLPEFNRDETDSSRVKGVALMEPLFEFSGACAGCGETPYLKLISQLYGDRMVIANATGCTSIYGGNLPTTPWAKNRAGRGPTWNNSLFEDNAEFGFGMRVSLDKQEDLAFELVRKLSGEIGDNLAREILGADQNTEPEINAQRERVAALKKKLAELDSKDARLLLTVADNLVKRSMWIIGGDGWAYDIGYGGLDHVLAQGRNVNILVLDTEVYSNTGGQASKATPRGAVAKFAAAGKPGPKKDLALLAMSYGNVYVARIAMGANDNHTIKAIQEAEAYPGTSLIIAYSHCIAHGYNMMHGMNQQKNAVQSGYWPLVRYNPELTMQGMNPMQLDSRAPKLPLEKYVYNETRYKMLVHSKPEAAAKLLKLAEDDVATRWRLYEYLSRIPGAETAKEPAPQSNGQEVKA